MPWICRTDYAMSHSKHDLLADQSLGSGEEQENNLQQQHQAPWSPLTLHNSILVLVLVIELLLVLVIIELLLVCASVELLIVFNLLGLVIVFVFIKLFLVFNLLELLIGFAFIERLLILVNPLWLEPVYVLIVLIVILIPRRIPILTARLV
jgi:hypothetical protein